MRSGSQTYSSYKKEERPSESYHSVSFNNLQTSQRTYIVEQQQNVNDEEKRLLQKRIDDLEFQLNTLQTKPQQYQQEIARSTLQRETLQTDFGSANQTIRILQQKISDLENNSQSKVTMINETSKRQIYDLEERLQKLQIQCDNQVIQINQLSREKTNLLTQCQSLQDQISSQKLNYKQEISEGELRYTKESQRLSLNINEKQITMQQLELKYSQLNDQFMLLQRKYDLDTNRLRVQLNDNEDRLRRLQEQFDQQTVLVNTINIEKQNLAVALDKLQSESNTQIYNYQSTIKNNESKFIRDQQQFQAAISEKTQLINELEKKNRQQLDQYFALQQQYDKDVQQLNFRISDYEDKLTKLSKQFDLQTLELNQVYSDKERVEKSYLKLQDEINLQKLRYNQELNKTEELTGKERSWFQVQLNDRQQIITEMEIKIKQLNDQYQTIQRRYDTDQASYQRQIVDLQDKQRNLQEQFDARNTQYNQLNKEKMLIINQFEQLQQDFTEYKRLYELDVSKLNRDYQRVSSTVNQKTTSYLQLESKYQLLNEEFQALQVRFEKETNNYTTRMRELEEDLAIMIENYRREQSMNKDWEQQVISLKNQVKYQVDETRMITERQLLEKYDLLTSEQKQEFEIIISKYQQDANELRIQLNQKLDQIRQLENQISMLNIQATKNATLIAELESANASLKYQINEQEQKIKTLILQEFDSLRDKSADQMIRNLMAEIKALQNKLKKYEVYVKNIDDQQLIRENENSARQSYVVEQRVTTNSVSNTNNYRVQQLENSLRVSQQREKDLQNQVSSLNQQLNSGVQQTSQVQQVSQIGDTTNKYNRVENVQQIQQSQVQQQDFQSQKMISQLNDKISTQEKEIQSLKSGLQASQGSKIDNRYEQKQLEEKNRRIFELENKVALLANENSRLNLMRSKVQSGQQNQYDQQSNNGSYRQY